MLNWDEYNKEETQVDPAVKNTVPEAPKHVESIAQPEPVTEASRATIEAGSRAEAARIAMETFDASEGVKELDEMHKKKTGRLIVAALEMGGLISNLKIESICHLKNFGEKIGLAFQITDDIIDLESPSELTGKTQGSDINNKKRTYPFFIGIEDSKKRAYKLCQEAAGILENVEGDTKNLTKLSRFIASRKY